jgi:hypothetical protein
MDSNSVVNEPAPPETSAFRASKKLAEQQWRFYRYLFIGMPTFLLLFMWLSSALLPPFIQFSLAALAGMVGLSLVILLLMRFTVAWQIADLSRVRIILGAKGIERRKDKSVEFFPYSQIKRLDVYREKAGVISRLQMTTTKSKLTFFSLDEMERLTAELSARLPPGAEYRTRTAYANWQQSLWALGVFLAMPFLLVLALKAFQGNMFGFTLISWIFILINGLVILLYRPMSRTWGAYYRQRETLLGVVTVVGFSLVASILFIQMSGAYPGEHPCQPINRYWRQSGCVTTFSAGGQAVFIPGETTLMIGGGFHSTFWRQPVPDRLLYIPPKYRHDDWTMDFVLSADGRRMVSWSRRFAEASTVSFWDIQDHILLERRQLADVNQATLSPTGDLLAVWGFQRETEIWRTDSWQPTAVLTNAVAVAFSPDGNLIAVAVHGQEAAVELRTTGDLSLVNTLFQPDGDRLLLPSIAFSPDGAWLTAVNFDGSVYVWRLADGSLAYNWREAANPVRAQAFTPAANLLVVAFTAHRDNRSYLQFWSLEAGQPVATIPLGADVGTTPRSLSFSSDGKLLAVGSFGQTAVLSLERLGLR